MTSCLRLLLDLRDGTPPPKKRKEEAVVVYPRVAGSNYYVALCPSNNRRKFYNKHSYTIAVNHNVFLMAELLDMSHTLVLSKEGISLNHGTFTVLVGYRYIYIFIYQRAYVEYLLKS